MNNADKLRIRDVPGGATLGVKVVPGSSRDKVSGVLGDCLKIATSAAPEKGKANAAVAAILADALGVNPRDVRLSSGPTNPRKEFFIAGLSVEEIRSRLSIL
jgi:uncharacterized protein YggU (UPF0235/DUF167 family)